MAGIPKLTFGPKPGTARWSEFCDWVRKFLVVDHLTGLVLYRPRDGSYFYWRDDPDGAAFEWNSGNAGRPVRVYRGRQDWAYIKFDGCLAAWSSVRMALGLLDGYDPNSELPDPATLKDRDLVQIWGLDYAIMREKMIREREASRLATFLLAVERYEKRIGRELAAAERAVVEKKVKPRRAIRKIEEDEV